jgi:transcriptional regulator with XRE-family HTH domain
MAGNKQPDAPGLGERLRAVRQALGVTITEAAEAAGVTEGTIRQLEGGAITSPSLFVGLRLAEYLRVDPYYLAFGEHSSVTARLAAVERRVKDLERTPRRPS